jgi:hypothetical protein
MTTLDPGGASVYRVAGRTYPLKSSPGCGVCKSKFRTAVENMLCQGMSPAKVAAELALLVPEPERLKDYQIRNHLRPLRGGETHIPHFEEVRRAIIERRFTELQIDPETEAARAIDHVGFLRLVVSDAIENLLARNLRIRTVTEALAAVNLLDRIEGATGPTVADMSRGISIIMSAVKANTTTAEYSSISKDLLSDPHILMLMGQKAAQAAQPVSVAAHALPA